MRSFISTLRLERASGTIHATTISERFTKNTKLGKKDGLTILTMQRRIKKIKKTRKTKKKKRIRTTDVLEASATSAFRSTTCPNQVNLYLVRKTRSCSLIVGRKQQPSPQSTKMLHRRQQESQKMQTSTNQTMCSRAAGSMMMPRDVRLLIMISKWTNRDWKMNTKTSSRRSNVNMKRSGAREHARWMQIWRERRGLSGKT
mmetsp:Transcript_20198/g.31639  ORF Transcript_20198/g.31639 Transcript_20198/m.31639 type:complete len:201 (-) Transcript_20198:1549-2151(-)